MTKCFTPLSAATLCASLIPQVLTALPISEINALDVNKNGYIDREAELEALMRVGSKLTPEQQSKLGLFLTGEISELPTRAFEVPERPIPEHCKKGQRFYLQESADSISLFNKDVVSPAKRGALVSYSNDEETGKSEWELKGAIAWVLTGDEQRCRLGSVAHNPNTISLSGFAVAPYLSFDGQGSSETEDSSNLRIGLLAQWQFFSGVFDFQEVSIAPFFQTDPDGEADIYGLTASWTPYHFTSRLNGLQGDADAQRFDWSLIGKVNYLSVQKAGQSGLVAGTEYGWIGFDLGVGYSFPKVGSGLRLSTGLNAHHDILNDEDAVSVNAAARLSLGKDSRSSLELLYVKGREVGVLHDTERTTLNLRFAF